MRFDALDLHAICASLGYSLGHRQQEQTCLLRQRQTSLATRRETESRSAMEQIRERLDRWRSRGDTTPAG